IKDDLLHLDDLALYQLSFFSRFYPEQLKERYKLTDDELFLELPELLMVITEKRGFKDDYERASEMLILELRQGRLGRFTLDRFEELNG
ncbi:MAG: ribosome biogenesis GTPase YlqF, partial [Enterococcus sp.]|nr:ribosome biogenesis GTPase YlqF [Enterococcus sp.]